MASFTFDTAGSFIHFIGRLTDNSSGKGVARSGAGWSMPPA
jgi:hypothetical protein